MYLRLIALPLLLAFSQQLLGQSTTASPKAPAETDIVVTGQSDPDDPDASNVRRKVIVGSRIPQRSLQNNPNIASATSLGGLTSDFGVDAWESISTRRWKTCKAEGAVISKRVACALARVQKAMEGMHTAEAEAVARPLASDADLTIEERYVVHIFLYRIADMKSDFGAKRRSLTAMVDTGMMPEVEERAAAGTLASWALKSDETEVAILWYRHLAKMDPDDTQSRVNAGILLSQLNKIEESKVQFRDAISAASRKGNSVPAAWIERAN